MSAIITHPLTGDRMEHEQYLRLQFPGQHMDYVGISHDHELHTWRVGGEAWKPMPVVRDGSDGEKGKREIKREHRPEVWLPSGEPVAAVDFSRPIELPPEPYPAPRLTSVDPTEVQALPTVTGLLSLAVSRGWLGSVTFAEGNVPHATHGRPLGLKKSQAVRLARGVQRAVAVRMGDDWSSLWTWSPSHFFTRHGTVADFKEALR